MIWTAGEADAGLRLDKFLSSPERLGSRGKAVAALDRGKIYINDREADASDAARKVALGDVVRVWMDRPGSGKTKPRLGQTGDLDIVFEDDEMIVVNKPPGILSVPLERNPGVPSVAAQIERRFRSHGKRRPFVVHRIDQDTSGLVVFAKDPTTQQRLRVQFAKRTAGRIYLAVVYGHPTPDVGTWRDVLVWDEKALIQKETHARDPRGEQAIADYEVVERFRDTSVIEVRLRTGRRNQIRLQARLRGHMLVGESRYTFGPESLRTVAFHRQALHAHRLELEHPSDGRQLRLEAPVPADLSDLIGGLRRESK